MKRDVVVAALPRVDSKRVTKLPERSSGPARNMAWRLEKLEGQIQKLSELVRDHVLRTGQRCFTVTDGNRLEGLVTLHHIKAVPQERWAQVSVGETMMPLSQVRVVAPDKPLLEVFQLLEGQDVNQVPVAAGDRLMGMITRDHLLRVLAAKMELDVPSKVELDASELSQLPRVSSTA